MRHAQALTDKEVVGMTKVTTKNMLYVLGLELTILHSLPHLLFATHSKDRNFSGLLSESETPEAQIARVTFPRVADRRAWRPKPLPFKLHPRAC